MTGELPSQPKATILVVDDEAAVRRVLVMRLQLSGYRVICAEDGEQALEMFHNESPDLVVLAGWMRILTETVVTRFRVINLHPALPGELPGTGAIERAWDEFLAGSRAHSGVMVHEVPDAAVDAGPVLAHETVAFEADDDLESFAARVHAVEHRLLTTVVADICESFRTDNPQNDPQEVTDVRTG